MQSQEKALPYLSIHVIFGTAFPFYRQISFDIQESLALYFECSAMREGLAMKPLKQVIGAK